MYLLWGILSQSRTFFDYKKTSSKSYKACEQWLIENINKDEIIINDNIEIIFIEWFNELLKTNKRALINNIFKQSIDIGQLYISDYRRDSKIIIRWDKENKRIINNKDMVKFPKNEYDIR